LPSEPAGPRAARARGSRAGSTSAHGAAPLELVPGKITLSSEILAAPGGPGSSPSLLARLARIVEITDWAPLIGALPMPEQHGPLPLLFGVTGLWH
jgi:hypothetical protein